MTTFEEYSLILSSIIGAATIFLGVLALFGDKVHAWFYSPGFFLEVRNGEPFVEILDTANSSSNTQQTLKKAEIRVKLSNTGNLMAKNCRVLIPQFWIKRRSDASYYCKEIIPAELMWTNRNEKSETIKKDLLTNLPAYLSLALISEKTQSTTAPNASSSTGTNPVCLSLMVESQIKGIYHEVDGEVCIAKVVIAAENCKNSLVQWVKIFWDGTSPNLVANTAHFSIEILSESKVREVGILI